MSDLYQRIQQLSAEQRASLAMQLPARTTTPASTRLVAFYVPAVGQETDTESLRRALSERLPEYMVPSFFVPLASLPLTPNGKVDRQALAAMELTPTDSQPRYAEPTSEIQQQLVNIWAEVLAFDMLGVHDNFFEIGGDSILSIQIVARARQMGIEITPAQLFRYPTIAELAAVIEHEQVTPVNTQQELVTGAFPLTPIQHWFFDQGLQRPSHWNQALLLRTHKPVPITDLRDAARALLRHHDVLRTRFMHHDGHWTQEQIDMPADMPVESFDLRGMSSTEQSSFMEQTANQQHTSLGLEEADLFRLVHFRLSDSQDALLIVVHHLIVDGVSWRLLLEDLHTALEQRRQDRPIELPPKTTAFKVWSEQLQTYADLQAAHAARAYWLSERFQRPQSLPRDYTMDDSLNTVASGRIIQESLTRAETHALLEEVSNVYHTRINDVLLTALAQTLADWLNEASILLALEGHGRENLFDHLDTTRTMGWFTSVYPVRLDLSSGDIGQSLLSIKEQLRALPDNGASYGIMKYSAAHRDAFASLAEPEILFNYLGRRDTLFSGLDHFELESDLIGDMRFGGNRRAYLIEVNCFIRDGHFQSVWSYSKNVHDENTIRSLVGQFHQVLQNIIEHCQSPQAGGNSPSDFPLGDFTQADLDQIAGLLDDLE